MNSYKVLKFDEAFVYLIQDGKIKKVARDLFDFDIKLGDTVDYIQDGDIVVVLPSQKATDEVVDDEASTKSALLQGILNLFLETLAIHNNDLGNLKKIFSQLLVTLFMAWSLIGVILIEFLLLLESLIVFECLALERSRLGRIGRKGLVRRAVFHVDGVNVVYEAHDLIVVHEIGQPAAELGREVIFAVGKCASTAEAAHRVAHAAMDALLDLARDDGAVS